MMKIVAFICLIACCLAAPNKRSAARIDSPGCGQRPLLSDNGASELSKAASRIVGGQESTPFSWPSICSLESNDGYHICGSVLVKNLAGEYFLATAAHCIGVKRPNRY